MNDTDVDWAVYHAIPDAGTTIDEISAVSGLSREEVLASVSRLEKSRLVLQQGEQVSPLSITDFLLAGSLAESMKQPDDDFGVYIENGVIKVRK